jgi:hypothetical protein
MAEVDTWSPPIYQRANTFIQLEVVEKSATVGFSAKEPNILIPWPSSDLMSENVTVRYQSDVIRHNLSCSWEGPSFNTSSPGCITVPDNQRPRILSDTDQVSDGGEYISP